MRPQGEELDFFNTIADDYGHDSTLMARAQSGNP